MSDTESSTPATTPPCPILKVPPEIRNRIWTFVVKVDRVVIKRKSCYRPSSEHLPPTTIALAFTCRQIYREVAPTYYSKNHFDFNNETIDFLRQCAAAIGPANAESITAVEIPILFDIMHTSQQPAELWPSPNLKTLVCFEIAEFCGHSSNDVLEPHLISKIMANT